MKCHGSSGLVPERLTPSHHPPHLNCGPTPTLAKTSPAEPWCLHLDREEGGGALGALARCCGQDWPRHRPAWSKRKRGVVRRSQKVRGLRDGQQESIRSVWVLPNVGACDCPSRVSLKPAGGRVPSYSRQRLQDTESESGTCHARGPVAGQGALPPKSGSSQDLDSPAGCGARASTLGRRGFCSLLGQESPETHALSPEEPELAAPTSELSSLCQWLRAKEGPQE